LIDKTSERENHWIYFFVEIFISFDFNVLIAFIEGVEKLLKKLRDFYEILKKF